MTTVTITTSVTPETTEANSAVVALPAPSPQPAHPKALAILAFIVGYRDAHGYPPTLSECGRAVDLPSKASVSLCLQQLERTGYIERDPAVARGIRVLRTSEKQDTTECAHPADAVMWNPYNHVVQCHKCGQSFPELTEQYQREATRRILSSDDYRLDI